MVVNFSNINLKEQPVLILKNASEDVLGMLGSAFNVELDLKYNEISSLEFDVLEEVDGVRTPFYDDLTGLKVIELQDVGQFILVNPSEVGDDIRRSKHCRLYSLEYEFSYKKLTLAKGTYKFWDWANTDDTLLGMIMEMMPAWRVGEVSPTLVDKYRTFEVSNENLYNLIKDAVQNTYSCIFVFDTMTRMVHVRDVVSEPADNPVYLSAENLATEIEVTENTEDLVTRLDVNGAEGVDIRDVNPTGTNRLLRLDYFMTQENFSAGLIDKYFAWKQLCEDNKLTYYNASVQYALRVEQKAAEEAALTDLKAEVTKQENALAVTIQAVAQQLQEASAVTEANARVRSAAAAVTAKQAEIAQIQEAIDSAFATLTAISDACKYESYFTQSEQLAMDRFIRDGEVTESSFVAKSAQTHTASGSGANLSGAQIVFSGGQISSVTDVLANRIYTVSGGSVSMGSDIEARVISAVVEIGTDDHLIATVNLGNGTLSGADFWGGCLTATGTCSGYSESGTSGLTISGFNGYRYYTMNASEYEKKSVAWDLYAYGEEVLERLSVPAYTFDITCANFFTIDEFAVFKNALALGERAYVAIGDGAVLKPICIGVTMTYGVEESLELQFSDSFVSGDASFRLVDILQQSVSMGKNVDASKYVYSAFVDSGTGTELESYINSSLDVAKNAIISSGNQAITIDGAGIRLRRWATEEQTSYEDEQIWMNNNSIVMTNDGWDTAEMAIGKVFDDELGECWGIIASKIVGRMIAGQNLIIESAKKDGGVAVFRVDGDGARLFNSDFEITKDNSHIVLNPPLGMVLGKFPVYTEDEAGEKIINEENANFWVDSDGNLHVKGQITATSLSIQNSSEEIVSVEEYVGGVAEGAVEELRTETNTKFEVLEGEISSSVSETTTAVNELKETVTSQGTLISQNSEAIKLKATQSELDELTGIVEEQGSLIEQTPTQITAAVGAALDDYVPSEVFDNTNESIDGSYLEINRDRIQIATPEFSVNVNGTAGDMTLDENGLAVGVVNSPSVMARYSGPASLKVTSVGIDGDAYFLTLTDAFAALSNKFIPGYIEIWIANDSVEGEALLENTFGGDIHIQGQYTTFTGRVQMRNVQSNVYVHKLTVAAALGNVVNLECCSSVYFEYCTFVGNYDISVPIPADGVDPKAYHNGLRLYKSRATLMYSNFFTLWMGLFATDQSMGYMQECAGSGNRYSIGIYRASMVGVWKYMPSSVSGVYPESGWYTEDGITTTPSIEEPDVEPVNETIVDLALRNTRTHDGGNWYVGTNIIAQGVAGGGVFRGCMWFDLSPISQKTIKAANIKLYRRAGIGSSKRINIYIGTVYNTGPSGGISVCSTWGTLLGVCGQEQQTTLSVPASIIQELADGTAAGLFVWSSSGSDYGAFDGHGNANPPRLRVAYYS